MKAMQAIDQIEKKASRKEFQGNRWGARHHAAWKSNTSAIPALILSLAAYADIHQERFGSDIGDDGVLGDGWLDILKGTRVLLNGEMGTLDGGTLDSMLMRLLENAGFKESDV